MNKYEERMGVWFKIVYVINKKEIQERIEYKKA